MILPDKINGTEMIKDKNTPLGALIHFYKAFNQQDLLQMEYNWLTTEAASMSNPLGDIKRGWLEIRPVYEKIFNHQGRVYVEYYDVTIHQSNDMFCAVGRERGYFQLAEEKIILAIRTSRIYRYTKKGWRQLHHHGSIEQPTLLNHYQNRILGKKI